MSLFGSIQNAGNALNAAQIGLQVTGNNIANANTPGYIRQRVVLTPTPTQRYGNLLLGTGVKVQSIVQHIIIGRDEIEIKFSHLPSSEESTKAQKLMCAHSSNIPSTS